MTHDELPTVIPPDDIEHDRQAREEMQRWKQNVEQRLDRLETQVDMLRLRRDAERKND